MERLTKKKTAEDLRHNAEALKAAGFDIPVSDKMYIKLADYENEEERRALLGPVHENDENYID